MLYINNASSFIITCQLVDKRVLKIRQLEIDDENNVVTNSSFNGWIKQEVTFVAKALG